MDRRYIERLEAEITLLKDELSQLKQAIRKVESKKER
jgi:prefoldin subunit 5